MSRRGSTTRFETLIGVTILCLLAAIAAAILVKQAYYDPQVIRPTLDADRGLPSAQTAETTGETPEQQRSAQTLSPTGEIARADELAPAARYPSPLSHTAKTLPVGFPSVEGVSSIGPEETFDATTLSDKIDGRAEFYLDLGFESLVAQRFEIATQPPKPFEAFLFHMNSPMAAFAAWSNQRRPDAKVEPSLPLAYSTANAFYFVRGASYVELVSPAEGFSREPRLLAFAKQLHDALPSGAQDVDVAGLLPAEGRVAGTERLLLKDAFGFSRLDQVILADYRVEGTTLTVFVSPRRSAEEAADLARAYHTYLTQEMGAEDVSGRLAGESGIYAADALGEYELVRACGSRLVGIHAAKNGEAARKFLSRLCDGSAYKSPQDTSVSLSAQASGEAGAGEVERSIQGNER